MSAIVLPAPFWKAVDSEVTELTSRTTVVAPSSPTARSTPTAIPPPRMPAAASAAARRDRDDRGGHLREGPADPHRYGTTDHRRGQSVLPAVVRRCKGRSLGP